MEVAPSPWDPVDHGQIDSEARRRASCGEFRRLGVKREHILCMARRSRGSQKPELDLVVDSMRIIPLEAKFHESMAWMCRLKELNWR